MEKLSTILPAALSESSSAEPLKSTRICERHNIEYRLYGSGRAVVAICDECGKEQEAEAENRKKSDESRRSASILAGDTISCLPLRFRSATTKDFNFAYDYDLSESLLITGACGTGKTHLAVALAKCGLLMDDKTAAFFNYQEIMVRVKSSFRDESKSMESIINKLLKGFVILDDIATGKPSEIAVETLYVIVNSRYDNMLPTIYTTNLSLGEIASVYGDRIASRLSSFRRIQLTGKDRRNEAAK